MQTEVSQYWPGAATEEDSYCTGVILEPIDELIREDLFTNMKQLGITYLDDEKPWDILVHGIYYTSDLLMIARGVLPEKNPFPQRLLPGPGNRAVVKVEVRDGLI